MAIDLMIMVMIYGKLQKGRGLGRKLGFPTLNMAYDGKLRGVFAAKVFLYGKWLKAAVHLGSKPTLNDKVSVCEIHVIDGDAKLVKRKLEERKLKIGAELKVKILAKIRDIKKFPTLAALKHQLAKDIEFVKMKS